MRQGKEYAYLAYLEWMKSSFIVFEGILGEQDKAERQKLRKNPLELRSDSFDRNRINAGGEVFKWSG